MGRGKRVVMKLKTPGQAAHDTWCELDDWDELDDDERALWEETAIAGHNAIVGAGEERLWDRLTACSASTTLPITC
jgi:hypothetical protein